MLLYMRGLRGSAVRKSPGCLAPAWRRRSPAISARGDAATVSSASPGFSPGGREKLPRAALLTAEGRRGAMNLHPFLRQCQERPVPLHGVLFKGAPLNGVDIKAHH